MIYYTEWWIMVSNILDAQLITSRNDLLSNTQCVSFANSSICRPWCITCILNLKYELHYFHFNNTPLVVISPTQRFKKTFKVILTHIIWYQEAINCVYVISNPLYFSYIWRIIITTSNMKKINYKFGDNVGGKWLITFVS